VVIPFLESTHKKYGQSVFKMINNCIGGTGSITLDDKYKDACTAIDEKFNDKMINIATITVSLEMIGGMRPRSKSKQTNKISNKVSNKLSKQVSKKVSRITPKEELTQRNLNSLGTGLIHIYLIRIDGESDSGDSENRDIEDRNEMLEELRVSGHLIFSVLKSNFIKNVNLVPALEGKGLDIKHSIPALLEGIMLSSYKFDKYKTEKALERQGLKQVYHLENLHLIAKGQGTGYLTSAIDKLEKVVGSVFLARDLVNEPANDNRFGRFMERIKEFIRQMQVPVELDIWDKSQLEKMGMGLILGVGKGSMPENAPCMLIVKYHPRGKGRGSDSGKGMDTDKEVSPDWVLLGKGITFDTGGLDLKSSKNMLDMKSDLSGAAAVVSFLLGYAANGGEKCIYTVCPFAENSISSSAVKPSDVLKAYDGRTVEVVDTDAEGRLVLADVIAYTVEKWPNARVMDLATLTGQAEDISGKAFSCILSVNAEAETSGLIKQSHVINEALVRLPLLEKESSKLESNVADIKNVSYKSSADIILSSLFMKQFIKPNTKWIHIDIAGPAFNLDEVVKYASPEASGVGVRLLFEYFSK
jgi:leucyl aminopeptidase